MQIKMTIDECLEFADEWARGCTFHEGSQGWRVVCMLLAEEVRRLRSDATSCEWSQDDDGNWTTECGGMFVINEGTPKDNDMSFCCYCGEPLKTANDQAQGRGAGFIAPLPWSGGLCGWR